MAEIKSVTSHPRLDEAIGMLRDVISIPSFSGEEKDVADLWQCWLAQNCHGTLRRLHNNLFVTCASFRPGRPLLMLNSHIDTVRPAASWTRDPFSPDRQPDRLYGLGSNDAGASGVALALTFAALSERDDLPVNLLLALTANEERMGEDGMRAFLPHLRRLGLYLDMAIVGEPTGMRPAVAERGLVVLDAVTEGKSGHAARDEGINAIYRAIDDIEAIRRFSPERVSQTLGPIKTSVTMIGAGTQHNVVPDRCSYVVDVRTTDAYTNEQTVEMLRKAVKWSTLTPRSTRIRASVIDPGHPLALSATAECGSPFVSPTTSDMALMPDIPSLKIGPGESARSHSADEFIKFSEINAALFAYPAIIKGIKS